MIKVSCRFAHSFKFMRMPQPTIPICDPLQLVAVIWSVSADAIEVLYIRCHNGRVPEVFELWALADDKVCEVQPYAIFMIFSDFREDTFQTFFFNAQQFQITFLGRTALNASVEFLDVVSVTQHVGSRVDYTPNIFIHSWGFNPTDTIPANVSTITWRAYDPIFFSRIRLAVQSRAS